MWCIRRWYWGLTVFMVLALAPAADAKPKLIKCPGSNAHVWNESQCPNLGGGGGPAGFPGGGPGGSGGLLGAIGDLIGGIAGGLTGGLL